ncbi:hypothetical protein EVAR_73500_1 [Eumeta japonica]|uniref:Uncharacterized protein n=1 Tax=Eumeta variegata TaxID=151549 RepID=A0A4C1T1A3_EUMVA|nr:hypothetical protein EVAR_73500_1 [Eumeta japonica]
MTCRGLEKPRIHHVSNDIKWRYRCNCITIGAFQSFEIRESDSGTRMVSALSSSRKALCKLDFESNYELLNRVEVNLLLRVLDLEQRRRPRIDDNRAPPTFDLRRASLVGLTS